MRLQERKSDAERRRRLRIKADPGKNVHDKGKHRTNEKQLKEKRKQEKKTIRINDLTPTYTPTNT